MPDQPTKQQLIAALRTTSDDLVTKLRAASPDTLSRGVYENGWNAKQILAHVASIEWTYPRLIDIAREAAANGDAHPTAASPPDVHRTSDAEGAGLPTRRAEGGILSYNDRQVAKREDASVADLVAEFEKNRAATIAAVAAVDDALFAVTIRSAGGITGPLAGVINAVAVEHVRMHVADITGEPWAGVRV